MDKDNYRERLSERVKECRGKSPDGDRERKHKYYMKNRDKILAKRKEAKMEYKISKESVDRVFCTRYPILHIPFEFNEKSEFHNFGGCFHKKYMAEVIKTTDRVICDAIQRYACERGITDLFLIDEEFIRSAIDNEIRRRKELIK
jgi:hypothetical protein